MKIAYHITGSIAILLGLYGIFFNRSSYVNVLVLIFFGLTWWLKNRSNL